jgi:2'-5' RNA ligase
VTGLRRAFVAAVPPPTVLDAVEQLVAPLRAGSPPALRWAKRETWHLTLQFLGGVGDAVALGESLGESLRECERVMVELGGGGAFPSAGRGTVLWLGVRRGGEGLGVLAAAVRRGTRPLGHEPESRAYHPHLTLARSSRARPLRALVDALGDGAVGPGWPLDAVVVMESDTRPSGAVYREVARFPLGRGVGTNA